MACYRAYVIAWNAWEVLVMDNIWQEGYIASHPDIVGGEPIFVGTRTPVRAIVEIYRLGIAPEEIPARLPYLTLAQVFAALSYFQDHQGQILALIEENRIPDNLLDSRIGRSRHGAAG